MGLSRFGWLALCTITIGSCFLLLGVLTLTLVPAMVQKAVLERDHLGTDDHNGTRIPNNMTQSWLAPEYDMKMHIWIYNVKNAASVMMGAKPVVQEIGPFVFNEKQEKKFHRFDENETRVFYRNNHLYFYNESLSCSSCTLDRKVKLVDIANMGPVYAFFINGLQSLESLFIEVTVGQALFEGYEDPLLSKVCGQFTSICKLMKIPQRIGLFYGQNNTNDGLYEVHTGKLDPYSVGKMISWNNASTVPRGTWDSPWAEMINGTDGQLFPPSLSKGQKLSIFAGPICRSVELEYRDQSSFRQVPSYRFSPSLTSMKPSLPENQQFCNKNNTPTFFNDAKVQLAGCLPAGIMDVSRCMPGNPRIYISQPHFYASPREVHDAVVGLAEPSASNDETTVDIEPVSGVPIHARRISQVNLGLVKGNLRILANTTSMIMPIIWMNETATFDAGTRDQLLNQLVFTRHLAFLGGLILLIIGALTLGGIVMVSTLHVCRKRVTEDAEPILADQDEPLIDEDPIDV